MGEGYTKEPMEVVTDVSPGITRMCIENGEWSFGPPNYYFIEGNDGAAVVDSGTGSDEEFVLFKKTWQSKGKPKVAAVIITHEHFDHDGGSFDFSDLVGAPIIGGLGEKVDKRAIELGERQIVVLPTPGHTTDSLCVLDKNTNSLFTGDTIIEDKSVVVSDMCDYVRTLEELKLLAPTTIFPGHGSRISDGLQKINEYIAHTNRRERKIVSFIHHGLTSVDSIARRMYPQNRRAGEMQVKAHVEKLLEEGRLSINNGQLSLI